MRKPMIIALVLVSLLIVIGFLASAENWRLALRSNESLRTEVAAAAGGDGSITEPRRRLSRHYKVLSESGEPYLAGVPPAPHGIHYFHVLIGRYRAPLLETSVEGIVTV